jgi:hypothetical protein
VDDREKIREKENYNSQVGVKAPGRPTSKILLLLEYSRRSIFVGGNPECSSTDGSLR